MRPPRSDSYSPGPTPAYAKGKARSPGLQVSDPTQEPYRRTKVRKWPDADEYGGSYGSGMDVGRWQKHDEEPSRRYAASICLRRRPLSNVAGPKIYSN